MNREEMLALDAKDLKSPFPPPICGLCGLAITSDSYTPAPGADVVHSDCYFQQLGDLVEGNLPGPTPEPFCACGQPLTPENTDVRDGERICPECSFDFASSFSEAT